MRRKDTWRYTLRVDDVLVGTARASEGMDIAVENLKVRPGGMAPEESAGGVKTREDGTLRFWNTEAIYELTPWLERRAGNAIVGVMAQPLDAEGFPKGDARSYTGTLGAVKAPGYDADSTEAAELEVEVSLNEAAT